MLETKFNKSFPISQNLPTQKIYTSSKTMGMANHILLRKKHDFQEVILKDDKSILTYNSTSHNMYIKNKKFFKERKCKIP